MPLPDASKKSPRVYTNLQNLDLDSVTFSNVQSTGNPINVEEANEDELRRLVLVNLARLVCAGEWTGLLEAGGGGGGSAGQPPPVAVPLDAGGTNYHRWAVCEQNSNYISAGNNKHYTLFVPFIAPASGDLDEIGILTNGSAAIELYAGIFTNHDDDNTPKNLMGFATYDVSATSGILYAVPGDTITLVKGTTYWAGFTSNSTGTAVSVDYVGSNYQWVLWPVSAPHTTTLMDGCLRTVANETALDTTYEATQLAPGGYGVGIPVMTVAYA